jgi:hypothetical protein
MPLLFGYAAATSMCVETSQQTSSPTARDAGTCPARLGLINGFGGPGNLPSPDPFLPPERGALATVVSNVEVTDLHPTAISLGSGKWRRFRG